MPYNPKVFLDQAEGLLEGPAFEELSAACAEYTGLTSPRQKSRCILGMMTVLDRELEKAPRREIMEACGRRCITARILALARRLQKEVRDLDDLLARMNEKHIGGGHLRRDGDVILAAYDRCFCGSVSQTRQPFSETYCYCSCGWYRQLFETLLERPVSVELLSSIVQGHDRCRFRIHPEAS